MAKIQVMDLPLANKIAAGEVVERPASVVKELVENAIDAGSRRIEVEIHEGGLSLIRVADDGEGMDQEDLKRAFYRHATSKLIHDRDLFRIRTLGFRGEALPSIAAVSRVTLTSRTKDDWVANTIVVEGGKEITLTQLSNPQGTEVWVRDLFFNTPARLKHLKSLQTEVQHIQDVMNRLAFSHPHISFSLKNEGKEILRTSGTGELLGVIHSVYGIEVAKKMVSISGEHLDFTLEGYISKPEITRGSRGYISILVNGRYVRSFLLQKAILEGYHTLLPIHRYPFAVLHLKMDPTLVDVNVHPAKMEVRFSKEEELAKWLKDLVRSTLLHSTLIPTHSKKDVKPRPWSKQERVELDWQVKEPEGYMELAREKQDQAVKFAADAKEIKARETEVSTSKASTTVIDSPLRQDLNEQDVNKYHQEVDQQGKTTIPYLEPLAQLHGTYILAQNEEGLFLIDQHAAQERINYERIRRSLAQGVTSSQLLAIPYTLEFTHSEAEVIRRSQKLIHEIGIGMEAFGERSFIVREIPNWFLREKEQEQIDELMHLILTGKGEFSIPDIQDQAAQLMACKASIKANQYLTREEMTLLLSQLAKADNPYTCPHGRPILIHFSVYEIEKMFKRVI